MLIRLTTTRTGSFPTLFYDSEVSELTVESVLRVWRECMSMEVYRLQRRSMPVAAKTTTVIPNGLILKIDDGRGEIYTLRAERYDQNSETGTEKKPER